MGLAGSAAHAHAVHRAVAQADGRRLSVTDRLEGKARLPVLAANRRWPFPMTDIPAYVRFGAQRQAGVDPDRPPGCLQRRRSVAGWAQTTPPNGGLERDGR